MLGETQVVYHDGHERHVFPEVLISMGLANGDNVDDVQLLECIIGNLSLLLAEMLKKYKEAGDEFTVYNLDIPLMASVVKQVKSDFTEYLNLPEFIQCCVGHVAVISEVISEIEYIRSQGSAHVYNLSSLKARVAALDTQIAEINF